MASPKIAPPQEQDIAQAANRPCHLDYPLSIAAAPVANAAHSAERIASSRLPFIVSE